MRIQSNLTAKNSHRVYEKRNEKAAKSGEKLASGMRVNSAADDSAGLSISEKMRTQIRGLKSAEKGVSDGISLIQTAEGSLEEISNILQRMNELAVEAATGTQEASDRIALDREFQYLKDEIDDIADETTFNNLKILDGSMSGNPAQVEAASAQAASSRAAIIDETTTMETSPISNQPIERTTATLVPANMRVGDIVEIGDRSYRLIDPGQAAQQISAEFVAVNWSDDGTSTMSDMLQSVLAYPPTTVTVSQAQDENGYPVPDKIVVTQKAPASSGSPNYASTQIKLIPGGDVQAAPAQADGSMQIQTTASAGGPLRIQGGALENEQLSISIDSMSVEALGIADNDIRTQDSAGRSITAVREAIDHVSMQRADLGAKHNRLEHKVSNLQYTGENTVVSESRIRDLDMATELADLTRNNVLAQGATAMLAQSNALAENVLSLLK